MVASTSEASSGLIPDYALRLLRAFPDPSLFCSASGEIWAANSPARHVLGIAHEQPLGCDLKALVEDPAALERTLRVWSRSGDLLPGAFTIVSAESRVAFNAKGCVIFPRGEHTAAILLIRFASREEANPFVLLNQKIAQLNDEVERRIQVEDALRKSEAALRERAIEAEMANRAKDEFLATVSHELRTPLNAMLGWSSMLRKRPLDADVAKGLEVIQRNAGSQARIIDDILDVSRVITGKFLLETTTVDLVAIAKDTMEVVLPSALARYITVELVCRSEGCLVVGDANRLRQVVWNLLSNALKFADRGGRITVEVTQQASSALLVVSDTGQGIEPAFLPRVFDRFMQADSSTTRRTGGLGLGLSLVRHIVELHGGSAHAKSDGLGRGATFTITLPIRAVAPPPPVQRRELPLSTDMKLASAVLDGLKILVLDDEPDARELLAAVLTEYGAHVEVARSVAEALAAVPRVVPHVLVSDIGLPDEDGYSFVRKLRQLPEGASVPALALTAYTRPEDRSLALSYGFDAHVGKPINPEQLVEAILRISKTAKSPQSD